MSHTKFENGVSYYEITRKIEEFLDQNVIRKSNAAYYSQVHMVPKPEPGDWRPCMDFRNLNKATNPGKGVVPNIRELFNRIGQKSPQKFSKFDLTKGYHQGSLAEGSKELTALTTAMGVFEWNRIPVGLMSAGGHFQREIAHNVYRGLIYNTVEVYIDDVVIPTGGQNKSLEDIENELNILNISCMLIVSDDIAEKEYIAKLAEKYNKNLVILSNYITYTPESIKEILNL